MQASLRKLLEPDADETEDASRGLEEFRARMKELPASRQKVAPRVVVLRELGRAFPDWAALLLDVRRDGEVAFAGDLVLQI